MVKISKVVKVSELLDKYSRRFDDIVFRSRVLLEGSMVLVESYSPSTDFLESIIGKCIDKPCLARVEFKKDGRVIGEAYMYLLDNIVFACIVESIKGKLYGVEAFNYIESIRESKDYDIARVILYSFSPDLLGDVYSELKDYIKELTEEKEEKEEAIEVAKVEEVIEERVEEREEREETTEEVGEEEVIEKPSIEEVLLKKLQEHLPVVKEVAITEGREHLIIDIVCDKEAQLYPVDIELATTKYYVESGGAVNKIKINIYHRRVFSREIVIENPQLCRVLGTIPEVLSKYYLHVCDIRYRLIDDLLEIDLVLKKERGVNVIDIKEVLREVYNVMKSMWVGKILLKARTGLFSRVKVP